MILPWWAPGPLACRPPSLAHRKDCALLCWKRTRSGATAGASSMIRNYLGFPRGVGGGVLAHRAWEQAVLFGAGFVFTGRAAQLSCRGDERVITLADTSQAAARAVIIAAGVAYRRLAVPALTGSSAPVFLWGGRGRGPSAMAGQDVFVVGAANSAGQAAVHLARYATHVRLLVRGESLADMSAYLITQLTATPNVEVKLHTQIASADGDARLETLTLEDTVSGERECLPAAAVFIMESGPSPTPNGSATLSASTSVDSSSPTAICPGGRRRYSARRCRSRPAFQACSPSATCATAPSNASRAQWEKGRSRWARLTSTWPSWAVEMRRQNGTPGCNHLGTTTCS